MSKTLIAGLLAAGLTLLGGLGFYIFAVLVDDPSASLVFLVLTLLSGIVAVALFVDLAERGSGGGS